jgi:hypothetical protein
VGSTHHNASTNFDFNKIRDYTHTSSGQRTILVLGIRDLDIATNAKGVNVRGLSSTYEEVLP